MELEETIDSLEEVPQKQFLKYLVSILIFFIFLERLKSSKMYDKLLDELLSSKCEEYVPRNKRTKTSGKQRRRLRPLFIKVLLFFFSLVCKDQLERENKMEEAFEAKKAESERKSNQISEDLNKEEAKKEEAKKEEAKKEDLPVIP